MSYSDEDLRRIFATAPVDETYIEVITLKASWFSKTYHLQNKDVNGIAVQLETGAIVLAEYAPMKLGQSSSNADLNDERTIVMQQVNDLIAAEIGNFDRAVDDLPLIESRIYIYNRDGSVSLLKSPVTVLPVTQISFNEKGASITASTKPVNDQATGILLSNNRFPMQKGFG